MCSTCAKPQWQIAGNGPQDVFAIGHSKYGSVILHSQDGQTFRNLSIGRRAGLRSIAVWGDEIYAAGSREILKSVDHGQTFEVVFPEGNSVADMLCLGPGHVIAVGYDTIMVTRDGGKKWNKKSHPVAAHLNGIDGSLEHGLYAVGAWDIVVSTDEGESWSSVLEDRGENLQDIAVWGRDDIYAAGWGGDIFHSTGKEVTEEHSGKGLRRIRAIGEHLFAVGSIVYRAHLGARPKGAVVPPHQSAEITTEKKSRAKKGTVEKSGAPKQADSASEAKLRGVLERSAEQTWISIECNGLTSLAALSEALNVEHLSFMGDVPDLATLPPLPKLKGVSFYGKVADLAPLAAQPALKELSFWRTVAPLRGVTALTTLESLDLSQCTKVDVMLLSGCPALIELKLPKNTLNLAKLSASTTLRKLTLALGPSELSRLSLALIELTIKAIDDLSVISHLTTLSSLDVQGSFSDIRSIVGLTALERLDVRSPALSTLVSLGALGRLRSLYLGEGVSDLSPLKELTTLNGLTVGKKINDVTPLGALVGLEHLNLGENGSLRDLKGISALTNLASLDLHETAVQDLAPLSGLKNLTSLNLSKTKVERIEPLQGLVGLTILQLGSSRLRSLTGIEKLSSLSTLTFERSKVSDLSPLQGLGKLEQLSIAGLGAVSGDHALASLTSLVGLSAYKTNIDVTQLTKLSKLTGTHGFTVPPVALPLDDEPPALTGVSLGPGTVLDGRVGLVKLDAASLDIALSPDAAYIATTALRGKEAVLIYETRTGKKVAAFGAGAFSAEGVAFSRDGKTLYYTLRAGDFDNKLELWSAPLSGLLSPSSSPMKPVAAPTKLVTLPRRYGGRLCVAADDRTVALVGDRVDLWDVNAGAIVKTMMGNLQNGQLRAVAAADTPRLYIWGLEPAEIARYDIDKGEVTETWVAPYKDGTLISIDRREQRIAASGTNNYGAYIIETESKERWLKGTFFAERHMAPPVISPDGTLVVSLGPELGTFRWPDGASEKGPRTGVGGYGSVFNAVDVACPTSTRSAQSGGMIAFSITSYRDQGNHLLWIPLTLRS